MITLWFLPNAGRAQDEKPLVHEPIVNAPLDQVWAAYIIKAGLESWMIAHADGALACRQSFCFFRHCVLLFPMKEARTQTLCHTNP